MKKLIASVSLALLMSSSSFAVESINVQTFNPSVSDRFVLLEDAFRSDWPKSSKAYFGVNYNFASEPLVAIGTNGQRVNPLIESVQTFDLMLGFKASSRFGLFLGVPIHFVKYPLSGAVLFTNVTPGSTVTALGDLKLLGKIRISDDDAVAHIALLPEIHLPTGNTENNTSDASAYLGLRAVLEREFNNFDMTLNLGFAAASNSRLTSIGTTPIDYRKRFNFGLGGSMPLNDLWAINLEFNSWYMIPFDKNNNPNELYAGLRHALGQNSVLTFGASLGKIGGPSGLNYRAIAGLRFTLYETKTQESLPMPLNTQQAPRVFMKPKQIELTTQVKFEEDSSKLTQEGENLLDEVAEVILKNKNVLKRIQVDGHTNENGQAKHNLWLSLERSRSVKKYLISKGVSPSLLEARGFGHMKPKVSPKDPRSEEINRRVEFNIVQ
jgi:outer membrane protein OmpA-like peptidoglycan-associated protein